MKNLILFLGTYLLYLPAVKSQNKPLGFDLGFNSTSVIITSSNVLGRPMSYTSLVGYMLGMHYTYRTDKLKIKIPLSFENKRVLDATTTNYTDSSGVVTDQYKSIKQSNRFISLGAVYFFRPSKKLNFGAGPKINYRIGTQSDLGSFEGLEKQPVMYLRNFNVSLLLEANYSLNFIGLFFKFDNDLFSRLAGNKSKVNEYLNTISAGITVSL